MKKAVAMITLMIVFGFGYWIGLIHLTGVSVAYAEPPAPNLHIDIATLKPLDPAEDLSHSMSLGLSRWPKASVHEIDRSNSACSSHSQDEPTIFYKTSLKAHLTAFRMVRFQAQSAWNFEARPELQPLTPEIQRDCPGTYDLLVLPPSGIDKVRFN